MPLCVDRSEQHSIAHDARRQGGGCTRTRTLPRRLTTHRHMRPYGCLRALRTTVRARATYTAYPQHADVPTAIAPASNSTPLSHVTRPSFTVTRRASRPLATPAASAGIAESLALSPRPTPTRSAKGAAPSARFALKASPPRVEWDDCMRASSRARTDACAPRAGRRGGVLTMRPCSS